MAATMMISGFKHLPGKNCLTTAIRNILNFQGFRFAESLVFGLAEGLGFQFEILPELDSPYLSGAGRSLLRNFCTNLDLTYDLLAWESDQEAMADLRRHIDAQIPTIVHVDLNYLPYFRSEMHFAGHRVVPVGYDETTVYLADTGFAEIQECAIDDFIKARSSPHPPYSPHRRRVRLEKPDRKPYVEESIPKALYNLLSKFRYNEPGYNLNRIEELKRHLHDYRRPRQLYIQIEKAGTGGGLSRRLFADFLDQAYQIYSRSIYGEASVMYEDAAALWRRLALEARQDELSSAGQLLDRILRLEREALETLSRFEAEDL
jgi:hypothetical protein